MNKVASAVSIRDMIFIFLILAVMLTFVLQDTSVDIFIHYDEDMLYVTSPRLNMDIPHADVVSAQLTDLPAFGVLVDGFEHTDYCTGIWKNDLWGEYDLCVLPNIEKCIVIQLKNGRTMVFNSHIGIEQMQVLFNTYQQTYLK